MSANLLINLVEIFIGFAGGLAVGGGYIAFLTVLGVIPRVIILSRTENYIKVFIACLIMGAIIGTYFSFTPITLKQPVIILIFWGLGHGIFNGMLAAALTEVLNVFPIISKRIGLDEHVLWLMMAIVFGKVCGSLFQWTILVK